MWWNKVNFVLLNDLYRTPYESWEVFDANLTALVEGGRIKEIAVLNGGSMYASTEVFTEGSGTDVDAIPIYDERGENVRVIYDDPRLKNLEVDFKVTVSSFLKLKQGKRPSRTRLRYLFSRWSRTGLSRETMVMGLDWF